MNVFTFTGHLGRDSEMRYLPSGTGMLCFAAAASAGVGENKETMWVDCVMFGDRGEKLQQYMLKGQHVCVSGEVKIKTYFSNNLNKEVSTLSVRVNNVSLVGSAPTNGASASRQAPAPTTSYNDQYPQGPNEHGSGGGSVEDDDIPF